ncbi:MAG: hypothetical protein IJ545_03060 [Alphaproteobacteria bacterium]|nr:hypothetical protein [Alphaproteobacteria bacterium]
MKKVFFLSIVAAIAVAMTFSSCSEKKIVENTEEPLAGTDYILVTTPQGATGIKKGDAFIIEPKADYKSITAVGGLFLAKTASGQSLLDPETGYSKIDADTIVWKSFYFEGKRGENFIIYIPAYKAQFAGQDYAVGGSYALSTFSGKTTLYKDGQPIIDPTSDFAKMVVLPSGELLVQKGKSWFTATVKDKVLVAGKAVSPKELKTFKSKKGWNDSSPVMILE